MTEKEDIQYYSMTAADPRPGGGYFRCIDGEVEAWEPEEGEWVPSDLGTEELQEHGTQIDWPKLPAEIRAKENHLPSNAELVTLQKQLEDGAGKLRVLCELLTSSAGSDLLEDHLPECIETIEEAASLVRYAKNSIPAGGRYPSEQSTEGDKE